MEGQRIKLFMKLAGQATQDKFTVGNQKTRELGAQLLLSEVLEYVIKGLGVIPKFNGQAINDANSLIYEGRADVEADRLEMLDGLADVAYTMYWNMQAFGVPLEEAFDLVCDNNLEKFVRLDNWTKGIGAIDRLDWHLNLDIKWPNEVASVNVVEVDSFFYAVGKDQTGKVRKPSSYKSVDLTDLL
jgi:predicted HAD superfamily Cof-like phosphohydrolase